MTFLYWLTSKTVRHATDICRHVRKILNAQRDLVPPQGAQAVEAAIADIEAVIRARGGKAAILEKIAALETVANKWLKAHPNASLRENLEVVLVAIAVALAVRTFFLQPFQIPTGSMQPTLFGITHEDLRGDATAEIPSATGRIFDYCARGISYFHVVAKTDGDLEEVETKSKIIFPFVRKQGFKVGGEWYSVWWIGGDIEFPKCAGLGGSYGRHFKAGEDIVKAKVITGDHLFVDRVSYNFRRPHRGEIIVFETKGIPAERRAVSQIPDDQFYIKRLVGLGGEEISIGDDRHVRINGERLNAATPHFEFVYTFPAGSPPRDSVHSGHTQNGFLRSSNDVYRIPPKSYFAMGDNTVNSSDGRYWGHFPQEYVIGTSFFVYWPILPKKADMPGRFGWAVR
ncbi:MAG: signal peptidase I [Verrucomicrobia bacterium]|nr:signal peptidase I [Verrucomicrobiota bacterium]